MEYVETIKKEFPKAMQGPKLTGDVVHMLSLHGFNQENTIFGYSTCPDEINRVVTRFKDYYKKGNKEDFPLGGLAGFPFSGITGFGAFSHHVPENGGPGNIFVLYGPHVGISENGELAKVLREGQSHESDACGSAIAALKRIEEAGKSGRKYVPESHPHDMEQYRVEVELMRKLSVLENGGYSPKSLVEANYQIVDEEIMEIIGAGEKGFSGRIALLGGVMINTPSGHPGYFAIRRFELRQGGEVQKNLTSILLENGPGH